MHVGHMASHVCGTCQAMCVTHGMPCVIMHGPFETYKYRSSHSVRGAANSVHGGSSKEKGEEGKREREERRREREERKGEREKNKRKGKKKREEEMGGREEKERGKEGVLGSEQTWTTKNPELRYKR